jgi:hypothetical protein
MRCSYCKGTKRVDWGTHGETIECYSCGGTGKETLGEWLSIRIPWWLQVWFTIDWYQYLFYPKNNYQDDVPWHEILVCRLRGHPSGEVYYNPGGFEPDHHCRDCGDEIG